MNKRIFITIATFIVLVLASVFYNYFQYKKNTTTPTPPTVKIDWLDAPTVVTVNAPTLFKWQVDAPADLKALSTAIYWSYGSSPSALTTSDSPEAVRYTYQTSDYLEGDFFLPDIFDARITFEKTGNAYIRAYAKIGDRHFWTKEIPIYVKSK